MKYKKIMALCAVCTMVTLLAPNIPINKQNTASAAETATVETAKDTTDFVKSDGAHFILDGKPFYFEGTNNYYLPYAEDYMTKDVFDKAELMGLTVMRTWGFNDGTEEDHCGISLQPTIGNYSEEGFKKFDYVIQQAKEHNIKLVIPFVNNWKEFGGTRQYAMWTGAAYDQNHSDEFFTNEKCKEAYKNYINYFLNRTNSLTGVKYKDDPTIMTWELANEPRCQSDTSCATLTNWIKEMSEYIKSIDPDHLVAIGDEGFFNRQGESDFMYNGSQGLDWDKAVSLDSIDYGTYHLYPDGWGRTADWGTQWIKDHIAAAKAVNKPAVLEEYGINSSVRESVYKTWGDTIIQEGGAGSMFWLLTGVTWGQQSQYPDYDGFNVNYADDIAKVLTDYAGKMSALNVVTTGDINDDNTVDITDYTMLRRYLNADKQGVKINVDKADINGDGEVEFFDLVALKAMI